MIGFYLTVSVVLLLVAYAELKRQRDFFVTLIFNLDILLLKYAWKFMRRKLKKQLENHESFKH